MWSLSRDEIALVTSLAEAEARLDRARHAEFAVPGGLPRSGPRGGASGDNASSPRSSRPSYDYGPSVFRDGHWRAGEIYEASERTKVNVKTKSKDLRVRTAPPVPVSPRGRMRASARPEGLDYVSEGAAGSGNKANGRRRRVGGFPKQTHFRHGFKRPGTRNKAMAARPAPNEGYRHPAFRRFRRRNPRFSCHSERLPFKLLL
jgi:hypothetical protein